jgi:DHA2 family multidrug resistance protein
MASFGIGIDKVEWVVTAYMLAMVVMLPTAGWLADKFGYKRIYFTGMLVFTIGSGLCGMAQNENFLIISRVIQGLGAGMAIPLGMAIITHEFPPQQRGIALGFWSIASAASASFGPMIGGFIVDNFNWQLMFAVNIPIGIIGLLATLVIQQEYKNSNTRSFDIVGFISISIALTFMLYALSEGTAVTNTEGWHADYIKVCFAISAIAFTLFITNELNIKEPLLDLRLLNNRNFGTSIVMMFFYGLGMFGSTFLLPLYLQNSLGYTAFQAGSVFLPVGIIQGAVSPISGKIADKYNVKALLAFALAIFGISFLINSRLSYLSEHSSIMISLYLRGFSLGMIFTPLNTLSLYQIPREKMAQASGLSNVVRQLGGSVGIAILATLLNTRYYYHAQIYSQNIDPVSPEFKNVTKTMTYYIEHHAGKSPADANSLARSVVISQVNKEAYIQAIDDDFMVTGIVIFICLIPLVWLRNKNYHPKKIPIAKKAIVEK